MTEPEMITPEETPSPSPTGGDQTRTWSMLCHLAGLLGLTMIPLANIIGPLVIWLIKKDEMPEVDREGKEALNFQISMTIYGFIAALSMMFLVGFLLLPIVVLVDVVLVIVAAVKISNGESYRYPLTLRLLH